MSAKALVVLASLTAPLLAGCETASSIFGGSSPEVSASLAQPSGADVVTSSTRAQPARIAMTPVMGAPDNVSGMLTDWVGEALEKQRITVSKGKEANAEYYLRGYVVAAKDSAGTKVSYIWDITDKSGAKRAHRIQGEQIVKAAAGSQDPWAAVDPQVVQAMAAQTAEKVAKWLPPSANPTPAISQVPAAQPQRAVASGAGIPTTTASIGGPRRSDGSAFVAPVVGAPGDGMTALTAAIRRELDKKSITLVDQAAAGSNRVEGRVSVTQPAAGKQVVQIEWVVLDPSGTQLGVVTQKNSIQQGALDGTWGTTADAAASAAAVKISSLLKK